MIEEIIKEIVIGIDRKNMKSVESDRRKAITLGLERMVKINDSSCCVLIAGKGHENYQEIDGIKHHFSDKEEVVEFLKKSGIKYVC